MRAPEVVVHHDAATLAPAIAARLIARLVEAQSGGDGASVCLTGGGLGHRAARCGRRLAGAGRRRLATAARVVGRRAVPAGRRCRTQRDRRPDGAARPRPGRPAPRAPDGARGSLRRRGGRRRRVLRRAVRRGRTRGPGRCARVRRVPAGDRAGRARRVAVPRAPRAARRGHGRGGARLPQATPHPGLADPRALAHAREIWILAAGASKADAIRMALAAAPAPCRCRPPGPVGATAPCCCWTRPPPPSSRPASAASPAPDRPPAPVRQRSRSIMGSCAEIVDLPHTTP